MFNFKEEIKNPPHMPGQFFQQALQGFLDIKNNLLKLRRFNIDTLKKIAREYGGNRDEIEISRALDYIKYITNLIIGTYGNLKSFINASNDRYAKQDLKSTINENLLNYLKELKSEYDSWISSLDNFSNEIETQKDYIDLSVFPTHTNIKFKIELVKNILNNLNKMVSWYPVYVEKSTAYLNRATTQPQTENVETLFHATTNVSAILRDGFKTRRELGRGALGGGPDDLISFTSDFNIASAIVRALKIAVQIAKGTIDYEKIKKFIIKHGDWNKVKEYMVSSFGEFSVKKDYDSFPPKKRMATENEMKEWIFEAFKTFLAFSDKFYNPVFYGVKPKDFENVDIKNIGIISSDIDMTKVSQYHHAMEEYRVPTNAILNYKQVEYKKDTVIDI